MADDTWRVDTPTSSPPATRHGLPRDGCDQVMFSQSGAVTGWDVTLWELMKVGERRLNMLRAFNAREGVGAEADTAPPKLFIPLKGGVTDGVAVTAEEVEAAKALYYQMVGWNEDGRPTRAKLVELALGWVANELGL